MTTSLWDLLTANASKRRRSLHCWDGERFQEARWTDVTRDAEQMTGGLRRAGVVPGSRVATILTNTPLAVRGILGTWLAGGTLASLPVPARGMDHSEYIEQLTTLCAYLQPTAMLLDDRMIGLLPEELRARVNARPWSSVANSGRVDPTPPGDDEIAFIQYSSGSTSTPKGCMLTPRAIAAQVAMVADMIGLQPGTDCNVSWLPLSHDMGIFGNLLTPWGVDMDLVLSTPERFMMSPRSWFSDVAAFGAGVTCGTDTGLSLAARAQRRARGGNGLSTLHTLILGAERIQWDTMSRAMDAFGPQGLAREAFMPAYGLAEATLAVTATPRAAAPRQLSVDAVRLADGDVVDVDAEHPTSTQIVSAGVPCRGVELPGLGPDDLSEVVVRSPALASGYLHDEERSRECFDGGLLRTGDLGFERDGHFYPVGRADDVIAIGGRKVYAREIEAAVDALDGIRRGCTTIVERRDGGTQRLTLVTELGRGHGDCREIAEWAARLAMSKAAVVLDSCLFLEKGAVPKTPSGKIQRYRCRQLLDSGRIEPLVTIDLAGG